ncbi:hypothetical protein ACQR3P_28845 [Rhodococcus sp. IEGM1300]
MKRLNQQIDLTNRGDFLKETLIDPGEGSPLFWVPVPNRGNSFFRFRPISEYFFGMKQLKTGTKRDRIFFKDDSLIRQLEQGCARCGSPIKMSLANYLDEGIEEETLCSRCEGDLNEQMPFRIN